MSDLAPIVDRFAASPGFSQRGFVDGDNLFRAMFDALPAAIYTTDSKGKLTYFNPACVALSGRTPDLGTDHWCVTWKVYLPDGRRLPLDESPMAVAVKEGRMIRGVEAIAERPDGTRIWFTPYPSPLRDQAGNIVGGINMLVDITESKEREERRRTLFEAMNEGFCIVEMKFDEKDRPVDYRFLETNPVFEKQTGIKNAKGRWMREIAPDHERHWFEIYGRIAKTGETLRFEKPAAALGRYYEVCAGRIGESRLGHVAIVFNDISERKGMEMRLEAALAASSLLHEVSTELIRDGQIEVVYEKIMQAAVAIMGSDFGSMQRLHPERGSGGELNLLASHGFAPEALRFWEWVRADSNCSCGAVLRGGQRVIVPDVSTCDFMAGTKDQIAYLEAGMKAAQSTPLISRGGTLLGMISTHWKQPHVPAERDLRLLDVLARQTADLIERMEVADQLRQAQREADHASRAKDKFLAVLSHELRTPLTPVLLTASELELRPDLPVSLRGDMAMIRRNVELQSKLIDDLLDMSRIMNGKLSLAEDLVSINEAVSRASEICRSLLRERGVHLSLDLADDLNDVRGDGARLQQVLWNLLSNAAKFTPAEGHIYVRTDSDDKMVRVAIRDTGRGIGPEKLSVVFNAFEQGDAGITREFGGLGLGLAICRAIVEQHRGVIRAFSEGSGQGTTFTIELPALLPRSDSGSTTCDSETVDSLRPLEVLLVEDHDDTARILARMLTARGHVVKTAKSGAEAIALADQNSFDVMVSDLGLPDIHGATLMQRLRARKTLRGIAMSGYGMEEDIRQTREAGFEEHLVKPVKIEQLEAALRRIAASNA
jgi:PAS domain S-box-containing protein